MSHIPICNWSSTEPDPTDPAAAHAGIDNVRDDSPSVALQLAAKGIKMN
jgi:hypothetical protein